MRASIFSLHSAPGTSFELRFQFLQSSTKTFLLLSGQFLLDQQFFSEIKPNSLPDGERIINNPARANRNSLWKRVKDFVIATTPFATTVLAIAIGW